MKQTQIRNDSEKDSEFRNTDFLERILKPGLDSISANSKAPTK